MRKINFTKMVASGNDFVVVTSLPAGLELKKLACMVCDRRFGIGADGMLLLKKAPFGAINMRIFNADGSEAQMCGNGARCAALYAGKKNVRLKTRAGIIESRSSAGRVRIKLTPPGELKLNIGLRINRRILHADFINTGVPHAVIPVAGIDQLNVKEIGRGIRFHQKFSPFGANVDFVEALGHNSIKIRTYERGVEDETLACGTGSVAAALIFALKTGAQGKINVHTQGGEVLKVYFKKDKRNFSDVWLEGKARIVYKGEYLCSGAQ